MIDQLENSLSLLLYRITLRAKRIVIGRNSDPRAFADRVQPPLTKKRKLKICSAHRESPITITKKPHVQRF